MARIHWFSFAFLSALAWLVSPIAAFAREVVTVWPTFRPTASESLALDRAVRAEVDHRQPGIASRFAEFGKRALTHANFTADHFDPGRMPA